MIDTISGILKEKSPTYIVVEVSGIGFGLSIPLSTFHQLPEVSKSVNLDTSLVVREDSLALYGFFSGQEKGLFNLLLSVSGIGPKLALAALSSISVNDFKNAVYKEDLIALSNISGVGQKMARRLILELKDRLVLSEVAPTPVAKEKDDAILALISLGYNRRQASSAVEKALKPLKKEVDLEELIKLALKYL